MNVGICIDNVMADLNKALINAFLMEDKNKRNNGIINPDATSVFDGMFDWSNKEIEDFLIDNLENLCQTLEVIKGAVTYTKLIKTDGHNIFIITGRNPKYFKNLVEVTKSWLEIKKITYDKLIFSKNSKNKTPECIENNINVLFDYDPEVCLNLHKNNIRAYILNSPANIKNTMGLKPIINWFNIYITVKGLEYEFGFPKVYDPNYHLNPKNFPKNEDLD